MRALPIYADLKPQWAAVELETGVDRDSLPPHAGHTDGRSCDRCKLGMNARLRTPCMAAEGMPGGLLVVGDWPLKTDDAVGRPFHGEAGAVVRRMVAKWWPGPVAWDVAMHCYPESTKVTESLVKKCRGFLSRTIEEVKPTRILTVGPVAAMSLFGRSIPPMTVRGGYSFLRGDNIDGAPIPVFYALPPRQALTNRFVHQWFEEGVKHALTCDDPRPGPWDSHAHLVETEADARYAEAELMTHAWVSFDVETMGAMWTPEFKIISVAVCGDGDEEPFVWDEAALDDPARRAPLLRLLTSPKLRKVGQNVKYDQLAFRCAFNIRVQPIVGDTRLSRKLIDPEANGRLAMMAELVGMGGLKQDADQEMAARVAKLKRVLAKQWAAKKPTPLPRTHILPGITFHPHIDDLLREAETPDRVEVICDQYKYGMLDHAQLVSYNARDSVATARLQHWAEPILHAPENAHLLRIWDAVIIKAANALERVEAWGVPTSVESIGIFDAYLAAREVEAHKTLSLYPDVNWNSPDQVAALFFRSEEKGGLGLPAVKKTKGGQKDSTDDEVLETLKHMHPLAGALVEHRRVTKMRGTYAQGMLGHVRADGRIHPNIKLDGARSGRTSCTDPNLQNIPRAESDEGKMARDCFVALPGWKLLEVDYSQLELRIAAMLSGDQVMQEIFRAGVDYHLRTAQLVSQYAWNIPPDKVEGKHRSMAKAVNFGVLYGKGPATLAEEWGVSKRKAQQVFDLILGNFKDLAAWCARQEALAAKTGTVFTWWDGMQARHRPLFRIAQRDNDKAASTARNGARNSPIQGTASEFCIASLVECTGWIEDDGLEDVVQLVLPVHDALMFHVRDDMVGETAHTVHEIMTGFNSLGVKLEVDFKLGDAWGSMEKYKLAA